MDTDEELYAAAARAAEALRRIPGVTGVGVGPKRVGGVAQPVNAIQVFVERKRPLSELSPDEVIPATVEGYPTNVATLGRISYSALPVAPPNEPTGKRRPPPELDMEMKEPVLIGGGPISGRVDDTARGTLGLLVEDAATPPAVYALTCYHVLSALNRDQSLAQAPVPNQTIVGQVDPSGSCCCSHCCDDSFGTFVQGEWLVNSYRDLALVRLRRGTKYIGSIKELGEVAGIAPNPTDAELRADSYLVRKYGYSTGRTGGRVVAALVNDAAGGVAQFIVVPHASEGTALSEVYFGVPGDSGAAVVTPGRRVMGLVTSGTVADAGEYFPNESGPVHVTFVAPLNAVLFRLSHDLNPKFDVKPVQATGPDDVRTVQSATVALLDGEEVAVRMPSAGSVVRAAAPPPRAHEIGDRVRADLAGSPLGRELLQLWQRHGAEIVDLVNHDRQVLATWHRSGASAVYQQLSRLPADADLTAARLPGTVNGAPLAECVARLHAVLARRGGAELRGALDRIDGRLPDLAGRTYPQLLAALAAARDPGARV
ncbi:hypothetical protein [Dactylosporangium sp. NPDC049140]|uniref:hypothetical protein n=1 Tax=Dactylosporangium sp. NPDC049140 TaxID=3155647 RepID=UPI0033CBB8E8